MTSQEPPATTGAPPPAQPPHAAAPTTGQPPVVVQHNNDGVIQALQSGFADLKNNLGALPESVINSLREAVPQPPQTPATGHAGTASAPAQQQQSTQQPTGNPAQQAVTNPPTPKQGNAFSRWWFGHQ